MGTITRQIERRAQAGVADLHAKMKLVQHVSLCAQLWSWRQLSLSLGFMTMALHSTRKAAVRRREQDAAETRSLAGRLAQSQHAVEALDFREATMEPVMRFRKIGAYKRWAHRPDVVEPKHQRAWNQKLKRLATEPKKASMSTQPDHTKPQLGVLVAATWSWQSWVSS